MSTTKELARLRDDELHSLASWDHMTEVLRGLNMRKVVLSMGPGFDHQDLQRSVRNSKPPSNVTSGRTT